MKPIKTLFALTAAFVLTISCQDRKKSNLTLFSDQIPTDKALIFAEGIISTNDFEFAITFNPEMDELFFTRRKPEGDNEVFTMKLVDGKWSNPETAFFKATKGWDFEPHIDPKGDKLYFGSTRPLNDTIESSGMHQWYSKKNVNGWDKPIPLGEPFVNRFVMYLTSTENEKLYFTSREEGAKHEDGSIFHSIKEGNQYTNVKNLAAKIDFSGKWIAHPYIAPDESYMIYDSQSNSKSSDCDLYISFNENGTWTEPYNLGPEVNTDECEMTASVSP